MQAARFDWRVGQRVQAYWHEGNHGAGYYPSTIVAIWPNNTVIVDWDDGSGRNTIYITGLKRRRGRPASAKVIQMPFGHTQEAVRRLSQQQTAASQFKVMTARIGRLEAQVERLNRESNGLKDEMRLISNEVVRPFRDLQRVVAQIKDWQLAQSRIAPR